MLLVVLAAEAAGARSGTPIPPTAEPDAGTVAETSYEECVQAAWAAFGPVTEAASDPGPTIPEQSASHEADPLKTGDGPEAAPIEEAHPDSPAHEMCIEDCPQDELCRRPAEFIVVRDDSTETISFANPELGGDPAA